MQPAGVIATVAALLAANGTYSGLDCVCWHLNNVTDSELSDVEDMLQWFYCDDEAWSPGIAKCDSLEQPSPAWSAAQRLADRLWDSGLPPPPAGGAEEGGWCAGALAQLRRLSWPESVDILEELDCRIADDCIDSRCVPRLNNMEWNVTTLQTDDLRHHILSQSVHAVRRITKAMASRVKCEGWRYVQFEWSDKPVRRLPSCAELQAQAAVFRERLSSYWRDLAQLLSLDATHASQLLVPLAFERMGNHASDQQLHSWIKDMERVKDMLRTKLTGWVQDLQFASKQVEHYEVEEDKDRPGHLIFRRPLLSERLLRYQPWSFSSDNDFSALCKERQPEASQMFSLAEELSALHRVYWVTAADYIDSFYDDGFKIVDEEWQLEDRSHDTLSVNTDCVQLLVNALEHPTCPLEDLPLEALKQREQCREQLWDDVVQRSPHIPVTSYLAYTQRINVNLCLLAWMAVNSYGISQRQANPGPVCVTPQERAAAFSLGGGGQSRHGAHWGRLAAHPDKRPAPPGHA
ncbi:uncharacterized protein LOC124719815 [Schistocerca piceifrons]|uniref:uncharacterized protein LOC124719815 n=1 Tax=Schistocerca piceifrons TaxID=274613 RepID=UPI001F5F65DA|nr:uncharacterized protein LOC124719815 [Schistocerca piceifrons]